MSNALSWADSVRAEGVARGPVADMPEAVVHPEDIAEVAVRALTDDGLVGETVSLSGPESLTPRAQAAVLAGVLGRDIRFESVPLAVHRQKMLAKYSAETVDGVLAALADVLSGGDDLRAHVLPGVERVLGRPARTFTRWVCENLHEFRWIPGTGDECRRHAGGGTLCRVRTPCVPRAGGASRRRTPPR
ncbi:hypothetical protein ACU686_24295 [Yinghuangia aomiensis]